MDDNLIKKDFDFSWKKWKAVPLYAKLALERQKGDVIDVGCATCELYSYLKDNDWNMEYYGIDIIKYQGYDYPDGVNLILGDAAEIEFPKVDTVILNSVLEHVDDPVFLLKKAIDASKNNVLVHIPKRNEELWKYGIVEMHQLDKTHKHCGFSRDEIYNIVDICGGKITDYKEFGEVNPAYAIGAWNNNFIRLSIFLFRTIFTVVTRLFSIKTFNQEMWVEILKND